MIRHALIDLRPAVANDFKDKNNCPLYGACYFIQNCNLSIDKKIYYLLPETNKVEFKSLFEDGRIWVFANPDEVLNISEETIKEWNEVYPSAEIIPTTFENISSVNEIDFEVKN